MAEGFDKDTPSVVRDIEFLLKPMIPERFLSVRGLVEIWKDMAAGLPEKDQIDVEKTEKLFTDCAGLVESSWEEILAEVIVAVKDNLTGVTKNRTERTKIWYNGCV